MKTSLAIRTSILWMIIVGVVSTIVWYAVKYPGETLLGAFAVFGLIAIALFAYLVTVKLWEWIYHELEEEEKPANRWTKKRDI